MVVFAVASLAVGVPMSGFTIALYAGASTSTESDRTFMTVLSALFVGVGVLLLVLRQRKLKRALTYRVFEGGIVRETSTERTEVRFADVARLRARVTVFTQSQHRFTSIVLVSRSGAEMRLDQHALDNVDESLIELLAQRTGLRVESL